MQEYQTPEHATRYLCERAAAIPHRAEGEQMMLELLPVGARRVLDLGTGDGRTAALVRGRCPDAQVIVTDFSPTMLARARERFAEDLQVEVVEHDLNHSLLDLGSYDAVVSSFAIHHVEDDRKRSLYAEIFDQLTHRGVFINFEHVSSPTEALHDAFLADVGMTRSTEDQSNRCAAVELQLEWLREIGFEQVDCFWKWRELAVFAGTKR